MGWIKVNSEVGNLALPGLLLYGVMRVPLATLQLDYLMDGPTCSGRGVQVVTQCGIRLLGTMWYQLRRMGTMIDG
jgi:hypothetical protein